MQTTSFGKNITAGAKTQDLFVILNTFIFKNNSDWTKCVYADGACSMSGCYGELQAFVRSKANALWTHCVILREALASKYLSSTLNQVLKNVVYIVNFIKTQPLEASFSRKLCEVVGTGHTSLLYYSTS